MFKCCLQGPPRPAKIRVSIVRKQDQHSYRLLVIHYMTSVEQSVLKFTFGM